jgi:TadE-like protein
MSPAKRRRQRGNMVMETVLFLPILLLLIVGMVQFGKITYVYYQLKKTLDTVGMYLATQQGIDFCDTTGDTTVQQAINFALTGSTDGTASSQFPLLTADQISVGTECIDSTGAAITQCSISGCDGVGGAQRPDYLVITIPNGYQVTPRLPYMLVDPILLKPQIRVPFGGT